MTNFVAFVALIKWSLFAIGATILFASFAHSAATHIENGRNHRVYRKDETMQSEPQSQPQPLRCSPHSLDKCMEIIKSVTESDKLAFASTAQDLNIACSKLQEGVRCADSHMQKCSSKYQRMIFEQVVKGTREVISTLCVSGTLQENYLRFAECYKNISTENDECSNWVKTVQKMSTETQSEKNVDEGLEKFCCAFSESVECQVNHLRRGCGEEAIVFFQSHLEKMSDSLINQHCASYTYGSDSCRSANEANSDTRTGLEPHSSLIAALIVTYFTLKVKVPFSHF